MWRAYSSRHRIKVLEASTASHREGSGLALDTRGLTVRQVITGSALDRARQIDLARRDRQSGRIAVAIVPVPDHIAQAIVAAAEIVALQVLGGITFYTHVHNGHDREQRPRVLGLPSCLACSTYVALAPTPRAPTPTPPRVTQRHAPLLHSLALTLSLSHTLTVPCTTAPSRNLSISRSPDRSIDGIGLVVVVVVVVVARVVSDGERREKETPKTRKIPLPIPPSVTQPHALSPP